MDSNVENSANKKYKSALISAGFSEKEASIYEILVTQGQLGIGKILAQVPYKRGDLYNILYSLRDQGVIEQTIKGGRINFRARDPYSLMDLMEKRKESISQASVLIESVLPQIFADYNLTMEKPSVTFLEGNEGLRQVYEMINHSGEKEYLVLRSSFANVDPEERELIDWENDKQIELGIHRRTISPLTDRTKHYYFDTDQIKNVERRIIQKTRFSLPGQVFIWGNTTAIFSMKKSRIVTVIENKDIADMFRVIFEYVWVESADYHKKIVSQWGKEGGR